MHRKLFAAGALAALLAVPAPALAGHGLKELDHPAPSFGPAAPPSPAFLGGGPGAKWELLASIPTGNPHTDIDFFNRRGKTYASLGTLAIGPNGGGQSIVQLTKKGGKVAPKFVKGHPSATCVSHPAAALGLQHDVEATPKGGTILNAEYKGAAEDEAQLLVDATDQRGRCHDQGLLGTDSPRGGLELIDITDPENPEEIGLTSHAGEAHTVNVDPRRPHIAYAVTSDAVGVSGGQRLNEVEGSTDRYDLDGFEVVDMSSCMYFPKGTSVDVKRQRCRPEVYRYRYPTLAMSQGHTVNNLIYGCHELEVYPDDRLTCGSGAALIALDMSGAFDDNDTPNDFTDDKPNGTPLPCNKRESVSQPPFRTGAQVVDCVDDGTRLGTTTDLDIPTWLKNGAPSLEGVSYLGTIHHMGRGGRRPSTEDNDFNHESELTASGRYLLASDERGGGVAPPGATCAPGVDNDRGNGGIHAFRVDALTKNGPGKEEQTDAAYAQASDGKKAIYRAPVRTKAQATVCTAHVFQQIPGQNRIFMGWYSQGTQVVDFTENPDGTLDFKEAGYFIPANANEWVSHVFKTERNDDGTYTYYGATGDFNLGEAGRNTIDVYKVTLPAPPAPAKPPEPDRR